MQDLTKNPLARVAALAIALGAGIAVISLTVPVLGPGAESAPVAATQERTAAPASSAAAPGATNAPSAPSEATTASAVRSVVAALTADEEVEDDGRSRMPRPASASRMYRGAVDEASTMTVYATSGAPQAALAVYTKTLEKQGFTFKDNRPLKGARDPDETVDPDEPVAMAKTVRVFTKGDLEALVTVSQGETGALLTVIEGPRRGRS